MLHEGVQTEAKSNTHDPMLALVTTKEFPHLNECKLQLRPLLSDKKTNKNNPFHDDFRIDLED
jgi:hypothetical protein